MAARTGWAPWTVLWALAIGQLCSWGIVYYTFSLFVVPMERELGWSRTALNGALSLGLVAAAFCAIPVGRWIDRHGGRGIMTGGSLASSLLLFLWGRIESIELFYLLWLAIGATQAAILYEPAFAVVARVFGADYKRPLLALTFVGGLASTVFMPLAQWLIGRIGWRETLDVLALVNLAVTFGIYWLFVPGKAHLPVAMAAAPAPAAPAEAAAVSPARGPLARAVRMPAFWGLVVAYAGYGLAFSAVSFHLVPLLIERGVSDELMIATIALIGPMQVAGRFVLMLMGPRVTAVRLGLFVYAMFPISLALLASGIREAAWLFLFVAIYGIANGLVTILRGMSAPEFIGPEAYGAVSGALAAPTNIMRAAGPLAAALGWSAFGGYDPVLWIVVGVMLAAACGFLAAAWTKRRSV